MVKVFVLLLILLASQANAGESDCLGCHRERDAALVAAWERSNHAGAACSSCHGLEHGGGMAALARRNQACVSCHVLDSKSYALSKHGVIVTLEGGRLDYSLPLREGNMRAPTCAYCHMHEGNHDVGAGVMSGRVVDDARIEARAAPCRDCHSPRLVETWFMSGDRMVEIGRMKVREAAAEVVPEARGLLERMEGVHLRNVRLGVGHQSPDDQWWHGHPALDGDLLRIKAMGQGGNDSQQNQTNQ